MMIGQQDDGSYKDMKGFDYIALRDKPELMDAAAEWFHCKWDVPKEAYLCLDEDNIAGVLLKNTNR